LVDAEAEAEAATCDCPAATAVVVSIPVTEIENTIVAKRMGTAAAAAALRHQFIL
jgi:hypothetical protein